MSDVMALTYIKNDISTSRDKTLRLFVFTTMNNNEYRMTAGQLILLLSR